jgi:hypothetical protein
MFCKGINRKVNIDSIAVYPINGRSFRIDGEAERLRDAGADKSGKGSGRCPVLDDSDNKKLREPEQQPQILRHRKWGIG